MRIKVEKEKIIEADMVFIECGENLESGKKFFYLEMKPEYSNREHLMYKFKDFRKNDYIDEYELLMDTLLEKGYLDIEKAGLEEIVIEE